LRINRHSIFTKINVFFAIFLALLIALFAGAYIVHEFKIHGDTMRHVHQYLRSLRNAENADPASFELRLLEAKEIPDVVARATEQKFLGPDDRPRRERVYEYGGRRYIVALTPDGEIGLEDISSHLAFYLFFWSAFVVVFVGMTWLYKMIINSLKPLKTLEEEIRDFGQNIKKPEFTKGEPKDEIESIRKAFCDSSNKIASLLSTREIFLKNIAHELKTPIAKGLVVAYMIDEEKQKLRLVEIFARLNQIVEGVRAHEELGTEGGFLLDMRSIPLKRLCVDTMRRALISEESVALQMNDSVGVYADERLVAIALSNLFENGIKFSDDAKVECALGEDGVLIKNRGTALEGDFSRYEEPFCKETSLRNANGMGLGLYLTKKALDMQGMKLLYTHEDGWNIFKIKFA
jgi:two-component system, OmpR family, sensor kinase